ncbi:hypothetical protein AMTR_s00021p00246450 [Amborella trichopoda]|uniref:PH domain-containing protein n=1 Tax=Amborella trichopoda TaxID=13333 RepID=W1Q0N0_AMBTC|nr:hypothetical protein AMTR_s00021p00246450 [Amborella trichopoda]
MVLKAKRCVMVDLASVKVIPDHFEVPTSTPCDPQTANPDTQPSSYLRFPSTLWTQRKLKRSMSMLSFILPRVPWGSSSNDDNKVDQAEQVESLRLEIASAEEREAHLKARLEHLDERLRFSNLAGYLYIRTRWTALPGEPPIDDTDVDDWLQRFVVLHGSCVFFYLQSIDLSPQDSVLVTEIVEVGDLPNFISEDSTRFSFYILTCHGLRYEFSTHSKAQVDSWSTAIRNEMNSGVLHNDPKTEKAKPWKFLLV